MKTSRRFFSVRDKSGSHRRNKSADPGNKINSADALISLFKPDGARHNSGDQEKEKPKIDEVSQRLADAQITDVSTERIRDVLRSRYAAGNVAKTADLIELQTKSSAGQIIPYDRKVHMLGAINRSAVTCYLDALLFAMFARMTPYERMLKNEFSDEPRTKLAGLLRLWVNMLRSGKLISTDITEMIQDALSECGWLDAKELEQQDTSEAFAFITETLQLPLLQLQVDLFHQGKKDDDDHKIVQERLLNLAVPPDPEGKGLRLEDCLEEYFNAKVDVSRDRHEEKEEPNRPAPPRLNTIRLVTRGDEEEHGSPKQIMASPSPMTPRPDDENEEESTPKRPLLGEVVAGSSRPSQQRHRSTSVIQHVIVDKDGRPTEDTDANESTASLLNRARRQASTVVKAVTIPAWQFFRLIPWHAADNTEPQNDKEVAMNFEQRPVVGICLKRYAFNERHEPLRLDTYIDIPHSLRLPHFMLADDKESEEDGDGFSAEYKLVLQSVVCHRGESVTSGHYVAYSRMAPKLLVDNRRHDFDPPPDYEEDQWVKFDDLLTDNRVSYVDDIKEALKDDMPYLLFYQIVPIVDVASTEDTEGEPPSYADSKEGAAGSTDASLSDSGHLGTARAAAETDYFDPKKAPQTKTPEPGTGVRFSSELERPSWNSVEDNSNKCSHRDSLAVLDQSGTPARTPDTVSPSITPAVTPGGTVAEESTRERLSRAAYLFSTKSRSRPSSQSGEGRISLTMNRLGGFMRPSKEPLRDPNAMSAVHSLPVSLSRDTNGLASGEASVRASTDLARLSLDTDNAPNLSAEEDGKEPDVPATRKHAHKRRKHKMKGEQPERECSVM